LGLAFVVLTQSEMAVISAFTGIVFYEWFFKLICDYMII